MLHSGLYLAVIAVIRLQADAVNRASVMVSSMSGHAMRCYGLLACFVVITRPRSALSLFCPLLQILLPQVQRPERLQQRSHECHKKFPTEMVPV